MLDWKVAIVAVLVKVLLSAKVWCKSAVMSWLVEGCVLLLIAWLVPVTVKCDNLLGK